MNPKIIWNYFIKSVSYFHRKTRCMGFPEIYNLESTNICPMTCRMCPRNGMKRPLGTMDPALYRHIIDQTRGYTDILWLDHFGDPLCHTDLDQMVAYARGKGIKTRVSTNPTSLGRKRASKLIWSGIDRILISLDGTNPETYRSLRGVQADYEKAVTNIRNLLALKASLGTGKPFLEISMIRMKETENQIRQFKTLWSVPGIDKVLIKQFKTWDGSNPQIVKLAGEGQLSTTYQEPVRYPCVRPWFIITILWDGRVVPCCYDYDGKYVIGDLTTHSLKEIWNNRRMQELRRQLITGTFYDNPLCENCREAKGYPESPWYPLDPGLLRKIPLKSIWNSIQREEGSAQ